MVFRTSGINKIVFIERLKIIFLARLNTAALKYF
jgi:hypothetical protein